MTDVATVKQPAPQPSDHPEVVDLVIEDLNKRREFGKAKYDVALQPFNGRDPLVDLYQEQLDAAQYTRQAIYENAKREEQMRRLRQDNVALRSALYDVWECFAGLVGEAEMRDENVLECCLTNLAAVERLIFGAARGDVPCPPTTR